MAPKSKPPSEKAMRLFYCPEAAHAPEPLIALSSDEAHHALNVLRLRPGDAVRLLKRKNHES